MCDITVCLFCTMYGQVSDLISKIQEAYVETLEELSWMDTPSKEKAREKVQFILEQQQHTYLYIEVESNKSLSRESVLYHSAMNYEMMVLPLIQAMAIKEHIGYPDHILEENNRKLDQEYAHVSNDLVSIF